MLTQLDYGSQEEDLFAAALALPSAERSAYLKRACNGRPGLLERVTALIEDFGKASTFVTEGAIRAWDFVEQIGPYRLTGELGEGGCGIAYLAEQVAPLRREVAIKIIKPGMDTRAVIARFEAERQALALMDHPNVARVFDAGATNEGRPYFVMELVRGIRITEYCEQSRLTVYERVSLFIQVCHAIQHAHQKGIIHRDIKPSNVLVTIQDGLPIAKVIDFGIAKATQGRLTDRTLHTEVDQIMGTPAYISPEQAEAGQVAVDTRSDIYSLGVLFYELLTGQTPFDSHELAEAGVDQLRRLLRTEEPRRPSQRLGMRGDAASLSSSRGAGTPHARLVKEIRDDLDWIVMRCLEKEPSRRYQAVSDLILDIARYLNHESVLARPPSFIYTVRKLAKRNRSLFVIALTISLFITAFAVAMAIQAQRIATERDQAEREREQAQQVSKVAMNVLDIADPFQSLANGVSGSALLDQAAKSIERELRDQPLARARLLQTVGRAFLRRGEPQHAVRRLEETVKILVRTPGAETEATIAMIYLSMALRESGDLRRAREALVVAERLAKQHDLLRSTAYAKLLLNRGRVELYAGKVVRAQADLERSLELYRTILGDEHVEIGEVLSDLSLVFSWTDDLVQAEQFARQAISIFEVTAPPMYPDRVTTDIALADTLYLQGRLDESAAIFTDALKKSTELFGPNGEMVVAVLDRLAIVRYSQRRLDEAEALSRDAVARSRILYRDRNSSTGNVTTTLARTLLERQKYSEAEAGLREALENFAQTLPPDHQFVSSAEYFLGEVLLATNRLSEAEAVLTASMNRWKRGDAPPWRAMRSANALGEAIYRQGRTVEGEKYLSESFRELSTDPKADREAKEKAKARAKRYLRTTLASH